MPARPLTLTAAAAVAALALAAPAVAAPPSVELDGSGTWSATGSTLSLSGSATGVPLAGSVDGYVAPTGSLPNPGACTDAKGELSVTAVDGTHLRLRLTGTLCALVAPGAYAGFSGSYQVLDYTGGRGRVAGTGHADAYFATDGALEWTASGRLR